MKVRISIPLIFVAIWVLCISPICNEEDTNEMPDQPQCINPQNNSTEVDLNPTLNWSGSDPDGDQLNYTLRFGPNSPPYTIVAENYSPTALDVGPLDYNTKYYWYVVAYDNQDNSRQGHVWNFTTKNLEGNNPPDPVFNLNPNAAPPGTMVYFDASQCSDIEDPQEELMVRWDWENDGSWDTEYSTTKTAEHLYQYIGYFIVAMEVKDTDGATATIRDTLEIYGDPDGCQGVTFVTYFGQVYHTVEIGLQCWFKENLNVGYMINNLDDMSNNSTIERYCYNDDTVYCWNYGAYYQWNETMQYSNTEGVQGICPDGWHIPSDNEWKILEGNVDSQFIVGDPEWNGTAGRGFDVGNNLKSTTTWYNNGNGSDLYGFTALPSGYKPRDGGFYMFLEATIFWSSTLATDEDKWGRAFRYNSDQSMRSPFPKKSGRSVRCLKN